MEDFIRTVVDPSIEPNWRDQLENRDMIDTIRLTSLLHAALTCGHAVSIYTRIDMVSDPLELL